MSLIALEYIIIVGAMKVFLVFLVAIVATVSAVTLSSEDDPEGWLVPTVNSETEYISREQFEYDSRYLIPKRLKVKFYLFTKYNQKTGSQIYLNNAGSLSKGNFNKDVPTIVYIHGWLGGQNSDDNKAVRNAYLQTGNYNIISVDWSSKSKAVNYATSRNSVEAVGKIVAPFIDFLNSQGMAYKDLTVIGHSLGAHIAGFAGKNNRNLVIIIGLDPAFPLFSYKNCAKRLCTTDAKFVESIQTNGGTLGFIKPIGASTFYPNGGKSQPGCGIDVGGACAHARSWIYYSESVLQNNEFPSMKCSDYKDAGSKDCGSAYSNVEMGSPTSYGRAGTYYVPVNSNSPYGMG